MWPRSMGRLPSSTCAPSDGGLTLTGALKTHPMAAGSKCWHKREQGAEPRPFGNAQIHIPDLIGMYKCMRVGMRYGPSM